MLPLFSHKNADFVIIMQFLAIFPKMSPHKLTPNGKPWGSTVSMLQSHINIKIKFENFSLEAAEPVGGEEMLIVISKKTIYFVVY